MADAYGLLGRQAAAVLTVAPRLVAVLAALWPLWRLDHYLQVDPVPHLVFYAGWLVCCVLLAGGLATPMLAACAVAAVWPEWNPTNTLLLLAWTVTILAISGRSAERAAMWRWLVTSVYLFTALSKVNPAWLDGRQLSAIIDTRPHLAGLDPGGQVLVAVALGTILVEAALPVGLWLRPRITAVLGVCFHVTLVVTAMRGWGSLVELVVLGGLLVVGYRAFITAPRQPSPASSG